MWAHHYDSPSKGNLQFFPIRADLKVHSADFAVTKMLLDMIFLIVHD